MISPLARRLLTSCVLSLVALAGPQAEALQGPTGAALADLLAKLDAYAEPSPKRFRAPGMPIAVIQGKNTVFGNGYVMAVAHGGRRDVVTVLPRHGAVRH